jgi:predicted NUDIX family phosphoesterase
MQAQPNRQASKPRKKPDEKILVVPRKDLFSFATPQGMIQVDEGRLREIIDRHQCFLWRSKVETDPSVKQIIPYLIFRFKDQLFLMQRKDQATEQRLKNKYTLGIGGHIRQKDISDGSILDWAKREFVEEINFKGNYTPRFLGLLNDEIDSVGQVHTGFVYLLEGDSPEISIRSELQEGRLTSIEECSKLAHQMERWSQIVFEFITKKLL